MTEREIFQQLHDLAQQTTDPRGVGVAALVKEGTIELSETSSLDGTKHAEAALLASAKEENLSITSDTILYSTIEPCSKRTDETLPPDDVSLIIDSGVKKVVFAVSSPNYGGEIARQRLHEAGIEVQQIQDIDTIQMLTDSFNSSIDPTNPVAETKSATLLSLFALMIVSVL